MKTRLRIIVGNIFSKENTQLIAHMIIAIAVKGFAIIVSLLLLPAYLKYFENYSVLGSWFTILSIITWVFMFDFGLGNGLRNKLPKVVLNKDYQKARIYISSIYFIMFIISSICVILLFILVPLVDWNKLFDVSNIFLDNNDMDRAILVVGIGIFIQLFLKILSSVLYAVQKSYLVNINILISNLLIWLFVIYSNATNSNGDFVRLAYAYVFCINFPLIVTSIWLFFIKYRELRPNYRHIRLSETKGIFSLGLQMFGLQVFWVFVSGTHAFLITHFYSSSDVVEYQIYYKVYLSIASVFTVLLVPVWSASTKAMAEKRFQWVKKTYQYLLIYSGITVFFLILSIPFLQVILDVWLKENSIEIQFFNLIGIVLFYSLFILHSVNTSVGNGIGYLSTQKVFMFFAVIAFIPLVIIFGNLFDSWVSIIFAASCSLVLFELLQPIMIFKYLSSLEILKKESVNGKII